MEAQSFVQDQKLALQSWAFMRETEELMLMTIEKVTSLTLDTTVKKAVIAAII